MSERPWTAGPWQVSLYGRRNDLSGYPYREVSMWVVSAEREDAANEALIALAPEMAEAILAAFRAIESGENLMSVHEWTYDALMPLAEKLRAISEREPGGNNE